MASTAYLQSALSHAAFAATNGRQASGVSSSPRTCAVPRGNMHAPAAAASLRSFEGMRSGAPTSKMCNEASTSFFEQTISQQRLGRRTAAAAGRKGQVVALVTYKVAVLGAAGGIGQPLSLLVKMSPLVSDLHLYDIANVKGVAADLSHCNTPAKVEAFTGKDELPAALKDVDLVIIPAGIPRKPGMSRDDLFIINAGIVRDLVDAVAEHAPKALIHIISNPVNSTVPIAAEVLKKRGVFDPARLFGVTTLDVVRANTFVAQQQKQRLIDVDVPVIGGHAGITILPLLSKVKPKTFFESEEIIDKLTTRIQNAGTEVVEAYAAARFAESSLRALDGDPDVYECTYIASNLIPDLPFFASRVKLGRLGVEAVLPLEGLSEYEQRALEALKPELKNSIEKGIEFAKEKAAASA